MKPTDRPDELLLEGGPSSGLNARQWQAILRTLPPPDVDNNTSAHRAGFLLGVQYALSKVLPYVRLDR